ncbi:MAG: type II toxin-antitoxin system VapC family toxin [Blastocatellia bacterium]|nr:type II toxin-antitoxin system VapC family toxin [Blastocatellia bacterium]
MMVVLDASVAIKWYIKEKNLFEAEKLLNGYYELHAPELILPEFGSIVWKKVRRNELTSEEGSSIIKSFSRQNVTYHSHKPLVTASYIGADLSAQTVYDWSYLALAVSLSVPS